MSSFQVINESDTIHRIKFDGREIILVGTAHVSPESVQEVRNIIENEKPGRVCVEIDEGRYQTLARKNTWESMDIQKVLKEKKGFLLLANLVLSSFQKKIGLDVGSKPGEEMNQAILAARENNIPFSFSDRAIQITLQRAWRKSNFWNKMKLLSVLVSSIFVTEDVDKDEIEKLKQSSALQQMMEELAQYLPSVKEVLIDERDQYLASNIFTTKEEKVVAVVGAGHAPGIIRWFESFYKKEAETDLSEISVLPVRTLWSRISPWLIPLAVVGLIAAGFHKRGIEGGINMIMIWFLANGILAALGSMISLAHPLTVLVAFLTAPFTSMVPVIGVGFFTGLLEYFIRKPLIRDFEHLQTDVNSFKGWYRNRVTHILLVLFFSSLGSVIGTFVAIPRLSILLGLGH